MKRLLTKRSKSFSRGAQPRVHVSQHHDEQLPSLDKTSPSASSDEVAPITPSIPQSESVEMPQLRFSGFDFGAMVTEQLDLSLADAPSTSKPADDAMASPPSALDSLPRAPSQGSLAASPPMNRQLSNVSSPGGGDESVFWDASSSIHAGPPSPAISRTTPTSPKPNSPADEKLGLPRSRSMGLAELRAKSPGPDYASAPNVPRVGGPHASPSASRAPPRAAFLAAPSQQQVSMPMPGMTRDKLADVPVFPNAAQLRPSQPTPGPSAQAAAPTAPRKSPPRPPAALPAAQARPTMGHQASQIPSHDATMARARRQADEPRKQSQERALRPSQSQSRIQVVRKGSLPSSSPSQSPPRAAASARSDADVQAQAAAARHAAWEAKQAQEANERKKEAAAAAARKEKERIEAQERAERLAAEQERVLQKEIAKLEQEALEAEDRERRRQAASEAEAAQERGRLAVAAARENRAREAAKAQEAKRQMGSVKASRPQYHVAVGAMPAAAVVPAHSAQPPASAPRRTASAKDARDGFPRYAPRRGATQTESDEAFANASLAAAARSPESSAAAAPPMMIAQPPPARPARRNFNAVLDERRNRSHDEPALSPRRTARYDKTRDVSSDGSEKQAVPVQGEGWVCHGVGDPDLVHDYTRVVTVKTLVPRAKGDKGGRTSSGSSTPASFESADDDMDGEPVEVEMEEVETDVVYSDLFELVWTHTTPSTMATLVSHLDYADIKALRQTSSSIRFALGSLHGREIVLRRFLRQVGYRTWQPPRGARADSREAADPLPLSFRDCEAFLLSHDLLPEYAMVGHEYAANPDAMDPRLPRLARASCRAYNRVLTRLRIQPIFKVPIPTVSPTSAPSSGKFPNGQHGASLATPRKQHGAGLSPSPSQDALLPSLGLVPSPWKPGRAAHYRVWVPTQSADGWLSDEELAACERELQISGIWSYMRTGDVVWDCAVGDVKNQGKYIFDGRYLRDLAYTHDIAGHLPSWLNALLLSPSHFHNIIRSSTPDPIIYIDVLPWRNQLLSSLRLVQDHIESTSPQGRYRVAKWLYRAAIDVTGGQIVSSEGLESVDEGWHGKIVFETEGTAEHAKALISRCAGPSASPQAKAALLASVMGEAGPSATLHIPDLAAQDSASSNNNNNKTESTTPWAVMRERSRPGLIWLRPVADRARLAPVP